MHKNFYESFSSRPSPRVSRKKRKTRDMARLRSEDDEVLFPSFRLLMELANFSAHPVFGLPLIQADFCAITITRFSSTVSSLMEHRFT